MQVDFGLWDVILVGGVSLQTLVLAYLYEPRHKALLISLPIPFTLASLAVGAPVSAVHVTGFGVLTLYTYAVIFFTRRGMPIVPAIVLSALLYCAVGSVLLRFIPRTEAAFWTAIGIVLTVGLAMLRWMPHRVEPGHRTPLPAWKKVPIIVVVVVLLMLVKRQLGGFATLFPMVGVVASYEARRCLWTMFRQIPVLMVTVGPMMIACRLLEPRFGLAYGLAGGWVVFISIFIPLTRWRWQREARPVAALPVSG